MASGTGGGASTLPFFLPGFFRAASRSSWPSSVSGPSDSMTERKLTSPRRISMSPMGERQLVGGAMMRVSCSALWSRVASSRSAPTSRGRSRSLRPAVLRMAAATGGETRLKAVCRNPLTSWLFDSDAISMSAPSSTPCGCGLISRASLGSSSVARGKVSGSCRGRT